MGKILVLAEKPSAGRDYAQVLGANIKKDGYLEGSKYIVSWAIGHLISLKSPDEYREEWKKWSFDQLPMIPDRFETKVSEATKKQYEILNHLINREDVDMIINGGDAGREGELIQRYILTMAGNKKPVKRLWVSSLTRDAIEEGFKNLRDSKEFDNLYMAAKLRAYADWLIGMNYTRGITMKYSSGKNVLSIGRCQTPILKLIVDRDLEIEEFKKIPYFEVGANFSGLYNGKLSNKEVISKFDKKFEAEAFVNAIKGKMGIVRDIRIEKKKAPSPLLHNLTSLGQVINKKYGYSAQETLDILQGLYEKHKIVTYPRASAKVISESVFNEMKKNISFLNFGRFSDGVSEMTIKKDKRYVNDTKIEDHHAIIPDFKNPNMEAVYGHLTVKEKQVFDVIANTLIAAFMPQYEYNSITVLTDVEKNEFISKGIEVLNVGWKKVLSDTEKEDAEKVPSTLKKGDSYQVQEAILFEKETKPKQRYNEALLLSDMEKYNIGTEATRAGLIETLKKRAYITVKGKTLVSTEQGRGLIKVLPINDIQDIEYTSILEKELGNVADGKADPVKILAKIKKEIVNNVDEIRKGEGKKIMENNSGRDKCPVCHSGEIVKGKDNHFCSNYKEGCKFSVREILGKKLTDAQVKKLVTTGKTGVIKGFVSNKTGKTFDAGLVLKADGKIEFDFGTPATKDSASATPVKSEMKCPKCGQDLIVTDKVVKCNEEGHLLIFRTMAGKKLSEAIIKELLEKGRTKEIEGFTARSGKAFNASIKINEGKVEFDFGN